MISFQVGDKVTSKPNVGYDVTNSKFRKYPMIVTEIISPSSIRVGVDPRELGTTTQTEVGFPYVIQDLDIAGHYVHPTFFILARERTLIKKVI